MCYKPGTGWVAAAHCLIPLPNLIQAALQGIYLRAAKGGTSSQHMWPQQTSAVEVTTKTGSSDDYMRIFLNNFKTTFKD